MINNWIQSSNNRNSINPVNEFSLSYSLFQLNSKTKFSFSLFGSFTDLNTFTLFNESYSSINTRLFFTNIQVNYKINKNNSFKSILQIQSNWIESKNNNLVTLSVSNNLSPYRNWYFENNFRALFGQSQRVFLDSEVQKYFLKNDVFRVSLVIKNILNTKADTKILLENNNQIFTTYNYLPRFFMLKFSYFFENWAKVKQ